MDLVDIVDMDMDNMFYIDDMIEQHTKRSYNPNQINHNQRA